MKYKSHSIKAQNYEYKMRQLRKDNPPLFRSSRRKKSGCYIATAIYGSYDCPQVWTLRRYRDNILAKTWYGRLFIQIYYFISPTFVRLFGHTKWFNNLGKNRLDNMVIILNSKGISDESYDDENA